MVRHLTRWAAGAALALAASAGPAQAQFLFGGTIAAGPTFNRPLSFNQGGSCALSSVGTAVFYNAFQFTVTTAGAYTFNLNSTAFDPFAVLYTTFVPANGCTNAIAADDDGGGFPNSQFTANLLTGTTYTFVATTFGNGATGAYTGRIAGPGTVVPPTTIPEPSTYALIGTGLAGLAIARRRRRHA
ncbi:MAG: PEP-CTERM sorting domain-containing protein [Gemmatimonadaceae bacterium]|jgi:hypothetical protein|nr:PEP-CTERM sorting domain-containing protein [Gemmatimonadaceae bacterium]